MTGQLNAAGVFLPAYIEGYGPIVPYGQARIQGTAGEKAYAGHRGKDGKLFMSLADLLNRLELRDGMTVSFHHHLRNGDAVVNRVMSTLAERGLRDLHVAASGLFACHEPLVELMEAGVITRITASTFNPGPVARAISYGKLEKPAVLMTHGGRARAIESGDLPIDVAFIAAPSCDRQGNMSGFGPSGCGCLSYAWADARFASCVVAVTDNLVDYPCENAEIGEDLVDYVLCVDAIGDSDNIVSGTTRITEDPVRLRIAQYAADVIRASGFLRDGMSFQTGASGTSLAVAAKVREYMLEQKIAGSFGLGGIHAYMVKMLEDGLFRALLNVQCFDLEAVDSLEKDPRHMIIGGSRYASVNSASCVVDSLDVVVLGAAEIDTDFNVNVVTGSDGVILGASGGHSDCAAGAGLTVVVANLTRKNFCVVRDRVTCVTTPGRDIDVFVTEYGIAVNPRKAGLAKKIRAAGLPVRTIEELLTMGEKIAGPQYRAEKSGRIAAVVEYRDGSVMDIVYCQKEKR